MNRVICKYYREKNVWAISSTSIEVPKFFKRMIVSGELAMGGPFAVNIPDKKIDGKELEPYSLC